MTSFYVGRFRQRGRGVGNLLGSLIKAAIPLARGVGGSVLRKVGARTTRALGKRVARKALKAGIDNTIGLASDIVRKRNFKQAARARLEWTGRAALAGVIGDIKKKGKRTT